MNWITAHGLYIILMFQFIMKRESILASPISDLSLSHTHTHTPMTNLCQHCYPTLPLPINHLRSPITDIAMLCDFYALPLLCFAINAVTATLSYLFVTHSHVSWIQQISLDSVRSNLAWQCQWLESGDLDHSLTRVGRFKPLKNKKSGDLPTRLTALRLNAYERDELKEIMCRIIDW